MQRAHVEPWTDHVLALFGEFVIKANVIRNVNRAHSPHQTRGRPHDIHHGRFGYPDMVFVVVPVPIYDLAFLFSVFGPSLLIELAKHLLPMSSQILRFKNVVDF